VLKSGAAQLTARVFLRITNAIPAPLWLIEPFQILGWYVIFRYLLRAYFALVRLRRILDTADRFGFEVLTFFQQFLNAF
jgi:hypothetical protein